MRPTTFLGRKSGLEFEVSGLKDRPIQNSGKGVVDSSTLADRLERKSKNGITVKKKRDQISEEIEMSLFASLVSERHPFFWKKDKASCVKETTGS